MWGGGQCACLQLVRVAERGRPFWTQQSLFSVSSSGEYKLGLFSYISSLSGQGQDGGWFGVLFVSLALQRQLRVGWQAGTFQLLVSHVPGLSGSVLFLYCQTQDAYGGYRVSARRHRHFGDLSFSSVPLARARHTSSSSSAESKSAEALHWSTWAGIADVAL